MKPVLAPVLLAALLSSCANVTFYKDEALTQRTGLKFCHSKPYLLVTRTGNKDAPVKVEIIHLPDLENPNYAVYTPGWGTHKFTLTLSNGTLVSYGQETDSKGPETIKSVADLAGVAKGFMAQSASVDAAVAHLSDAIGSLNIIVNTLDSDLGAFAGSKVDAAALSDSLQKILKKIEDGESDQADALAAVKKRIDAKTPKKPENVEAASQVYDRFTQASTSVELAITALREAGDSPTPAGKPDFDLYEIRMANGVTKYIKVSPGTAREMIPAIHDHRAHK